MGLFAIFALWLIEAGRDRATASSVSSKEA
jgi:hypothetical protein